MPFEVDLGVGPTSVAGPEAKRLTWRSSLRIGAGRAQHLKGLGCHPGRSQMLISQCIATPAGERQESRKAKFQAEVDGLKKELYLLEAELEDVVLDGFEDSPYNRDLARRPRRKMRRKELQTQRSESEPALRLHRHSPAQQGSSPKDLLRGRDFPSPDGSKLQSHGGRGVARDASRRSKSQPHQESQRLPPLQGADQVSGGSFPRRGCLSPARNHDRPPQLSVTLPAIDAATEGGSKAEFLMQTLSSPSPKRRTLQSQALWQICSTAHSISEELDRTCAQLERFREDDWASKVLSNVEDEASASREWCSGVDAMESPAHRSASGDFLDESASVALSRRASSDMIEPVLDEARLQAAFSKFTEPGTKDLSIDNLPQLLRFLGHPLLGTAEQDAQDIAKDITMYEYLNFDEFFSFMQKYIEYEREHFHEVFNTFDKDESGELSIGELRKLLQDLEIMTLSAMFKEALQAVDVDCNGQLNFKEFLKFLRIYTKNEGFTEKETSEIKQIVSQVGYVYSVGSKALESLQLPVDLLEEVLVRFFGMHAAQDAHKLLEELAERNKLNNPDGGIDSEPEMITLPDILLYARRIREIHYHRLKSFQAEDQSTNDMTSVLYRSTSIFMCKQNEHKANQKVVIRGSTLAEFARFDSNNDDKIDERELKKALLKMGYEPLTMVIHEILDEVLPEPWTAGRELEFDEFFDFLLVYRQREGFLKSEVEMLRRIFFNFDEDNSGSVSTLELGDVFRYMGYSPSVDELKHYILMVDEDRSNELNFKEFLKLMQVHRSSVIQGMRNAFVACMDKKTDTLPRAQVRSALEKLGHHSPSKELIQRLPSVAMDFDDFVRLVDECHQVLVAEQRKRAGFSDSELEKISETFNNFDKDGSGDINKSEMHLLFQAFGWQPKTQQEQRDIFGHLDRARALAREAGVQDTSPDGAATVKLWEFVQLWRMIQRQQEGAQEKMMARLAHELKFTLPEVTEFREIFLHWINVRQHEADENDDGDTLHLEHDSDEGIERETVRRICRSMGVKLTTVIKQRLDKELDLLLDGNKTLDFQAFLHLMRWIIDTGFGGICPAERPSLR